MRQPLQTSSLQQRCQPGAQRILPNPQTNPRFCLPPHPVSHHRHPKSLLEWMKSSVDFVFPRRRLLFSPQRGRKCKPIVNPQAAPSPTSPICQPRSPPRVILAITIPAHFAFCKMGTRSAYLHSYPRRQLPLHLLTPSFSSVL